MLEQEMVIDSRVRALALVPALCWVITFVYNATITQELGVMLWICHITTLMLTIGLAGSYASLIRLAAIFTTVELPIWLISVLATHVTGRVSILTHVCVPTVAWIAMSQVRMDRRSLLSHVGVAFLYFGGVQLLSRLVTAEHLNVNLVFRPYDFVRPPFWAGFGFYWASTTALLLVLVGCGVAVFRAVFPPEGELSSDAGAAVRVIPALARRRGGA